MRIDITSLCSFLKAVRLFANEINACTYISVPLITYQEYPIKLRVVFRRYYSIEDTRTRTQPLTIYSLSLFNQIRT